MICLDIIWCIFAARCTKTQLSRCLMSFALVSPLNNVMFIHCFSTYIFSYLDNHRVQSSLKYDCAMSTGQPECNVFCSAGLECDTQQYLCQYLL